MPSNAKRFNLDLKKFAAKTKQQAEVVFKKVAYDLDKAVVLSTPVDTGRARGNWFPSINTPSDAVLRSEEYDKTGITSINRLAGAVELAQLGDTIWLTNNLPYINRLEHGHSKQAPDGMVGINLLRFQAKYGGVIEQ